MAVTLFVVPEEEHGIYCFLGNRRPHHKTLRFVTRAYATAGFIMPRHFLIWHMGWSEWWRACSLERRHDGLFQSNRGIKSQ